MQTETANNQPVWPARTTRAGALVLVDRRAIYVLLIGVLAAFLAYQTRPTAHVAVGWFGDRLFLASSEALGDAELTAGRWFGDELTDTAPTQRSRWTRGRALIVFPGLAARDQATLTIVVQGWPADAAREPGQSRQPTVTVTANGVPAGTFTPSVDWQEHRVALPSAALRGGDLRLELESETFTSTASAQGDPRPKGVRVAQISIVGSEQRGLGLTLPPVPPTGLLMLSAFLAFAILARTLRRLNVAFVLAIMLVCAVALGLVLARIWTVALLPWLAIALVLALLASYWRALLALTSRFVGYYAQRGIVSAGLVALLAGWLAYMPLHTLLAWNGGRPNALLLVLLVGALVLIFLGRFRPLERAVRTIIGAAASRPGAMLVLGVFLIVWLGYEAVIIATLQGAGHADYSDNAVVARNLLHGRGWVVDYVTQFYQLVPDGVTRLQETWPLLQPVWIVPFFALFGASDWAAKLPNLLFTLLLGILVYRFGARVWDRRVGLTAAVFLLTSYLFFLLVINVTSDLAFVTLSFAVLALVYAWGMKDEGRTARRWLSPAGGWWAVGAGVVTGLMMLQKPANGVFLAFGAGLWLLWRVLRPKVGSERWAVDGGPRVDSSQLTTDNGQLIRRLAPLAVWTLLAVLVLSPYLARNLLTFGKLFYSTESKDAWVLEYAPEWEWIYRIYTPEQGLSETEGLPDRSWILRWGFDRTLAKITNQIKATRDYLAPPWFGLPNGWSDVLSGFKDGPSSVHPERDDGRLLFGVGAWLSFLGLLLALRRSASLIALVALAFVPYTLFLVLYWHANEERYFVALMPWLALFAALALWRIYDAIAGIDRGRLSPLALLVALLLAAQVVGPSLPEIGRKLEQWHYADSDRLAYAWLRENTAPDDVVMTRVPWQLNWHSERPALMIPSTASQEKLFAIARHYKARYLVFDVGQRPKPATQRLLQCLVDHPEIGFSEAYVSPVLFGTNPTIVYKFPDLSRTLPERCP